MGSSYIRRGEGRAKETMGTNLGLDAQVRWYGWGGLRWSQFLPYFHRSLKRGRTPPDVLLIHCGSNDLGQVKSVELATMMKRDLQRLQLEYPNMKLVFSQLTPRLQWRSAIKPGAINKARKWVNYQIRTFVTGLGGSVVAHPDIKFDRPDLFLRDGVHFSPVGNDLFLNCIAQSLKATI